jgi:uncharacterized protein
MTCSKVIFTATGHVNLLGLHKNTLEFTKDDYLTKRGDCILGINSDFTNDDISLILKWSKIKVNLSIGLLSDYFYATVNKSFSSSHEIVFRNGNFLSDRTLGIYSSKSALDINRSLISALQKNNSKLTITISNESETD